MGKKEIIKFDGGSFFRQRLILATLTGQPIKIRNIHAKDLNPGLKEYHISFIRILDEISNGSIIEFNETGTELFYNPGLLIGGAFEHNCNEQQPIGYYLEGLICLSPFVKNPIKAKLKGITNDNFHPSVDALKYSTLPLVSKFLPSTYNSDIVNNLDIKIVKRALPPHGGGEVIFTSPVCLKLKSINFVHPGKIKKIRGVAYTLKVSPAISNRMIDSIQNILSKVAKNTYIRVDNYKKSQCGKIPGFGVCLYAETEHGTFYCSEACSNPPDSSLMVTPEEVGQKAAFILLDEIYMGGSMTSFNQSTAFLFMALGQANVSKIQTGRFTPFALQFMKDIKTMLKVVYKIDRDKVEDNNQESVEDITADKGEENEVSTKIPFSHMVQPTRYIVTCLGSGFGNISKSIR